MPVTTPTRSVGPFPLHFVACGPKHAFPCLDRSWRSLLFGGSDGHRWGFRRHTWLCPHPLRRLIDGKIQLAFVGRLAPPYIWPGDYVRDILTGLYFDLTEIICINHRRPDNDGRCSMTILRHHSSTQSPQVLNSLNLRILRPKKKSSKLNLRADKPIEVSDVTADALVRN